MNVVCFDDSSPELGGHKTGVRVSSISHRSSHVSTVLTVVLGCRAVPTLEPHVLGSFVDRVVCSFLELP